MPQMGDAGLTAVVVQRMCHGGVATYSARASVRESVHTILTPGHRLE